MSDEGSKKGSPLSRWSAGIQDQFGKAAEKAQATIETGDAIANLQATLETPAAQKIIAAATSDPAKKLAIDALYLLLPVHVRWIVKKDKFESHVRTYVFRETTPPK